MEEIPDQNSGGVSPAAHAQHADYSHLPQEKGVCVSWDDRKCFGFLEVDAGMNVGVRAFVHAAFLAGDPAMESVLPGQWRCIPGQRYRFALVTNDRDSSKWSAVAVQTLPSDEQPPPGTEPPRRRSGDGGRDRADRGRDSRDGMPPTAQREQHMLTWHHPEHDGNMQLTITNMDQPQHPDYHTSHQPYQQQLQITVP